MKPQDRPKLALPMHEGLEQFLIVLKEKMPAEQIATFIGLYHDYGAVFNEKDMAHFFRLSRRTLRNQISRGEMPVRVIKRGNSYLVPTSAIVSYLHQEPTDNEN